MVRLTLAISLALAGCSVPPEQPDLNTYGAFQPLCIAICRQVFTLTEGDGAAGALSSSVTTTEQTVKE